VLCCFCVGIWLCGSVFCALYSGVGWLVGCLRVGLCRLGCCVQFVSGAWGGMCWWDWVLWCVAVFRWVGGWRVGFICVGWCGGVELVCVLVFLVVIARDGGVGCVRMMPLWGCWWRFWV